MDERKGHNVRLGMFVFVAIAVAAGILFILGGKSLFEPTFTFETYFNESVAGLDVGAPVKYRGVPMGQVTEIVTSPAIYEAGVPIDKRRAYIVVRVKITGHKEQVAQWKAEAAELVTRGLRVQTQLAGITGEQYLSLDRLDPQSNPPLPFDWKPEYLYIPSAPSSADAIIANVQQFLAQLNGADIKELGQNLNKLTVSLTKKVDELPVAELSAEASALLKDSRATVDRLKAVLDKPAVDAMLADTSAFTGRLRKIADSGDIDRMVKSIDDLAQRLDGVVGDNQYDVRVIVQDLRVTADNLRTMSETLKRYPAGVLIGGPPEKLQIPEKSP